MSASFSSIILAGISRAMIFSNRVIGWSEGWQLANRRAATAHAEIPRFQSVIPNNVHSSSSRIGALARRTADRRNRDLKPGLTARVERALSAARKMQARSRGRLLAQDC